MSPAYLEINFIAAVFCSDKGSYIHFDFIEFFIWSLFINIQASVFIFVDKYLIRPFPTIQFAGMAYFPCYYIHFILMIHFLL